jgi:hypothetical protein
MVTRLFNIVTIFALLSFILFVTGFFFIGSQETFARQLEDLPEYFFKRAAAGIVISILGCVVIAVGNLLLGRGSQSNRKVRITRIVILTLVLGSITSLVGAGIFFFR